MSDLNQILSSMITIVDQLKDSSYIKESITIFVIYGCHTIAVKIYKHHPISKIMNACCTKLKLVSNKYKLENSIGIELTNSWPSGVLNEHENIFIKIK